MGVLEGIVVAIGLSLIAFVCRAWIPTAPSWAASTTFPAITI